MRGRKSKYETHVLPHLNDIPSWYETMTECQIAKRLGVDATTFVKYKNEHEELRDALRVSREDLAEQLKSKLKMKAMGFSYEEKKTVVRREGSEIVETTETYERYSPPDTGAIHLLLKNLDDDWRNDDGETVRQKREKLKIERQKAESENW